MVHVYLDFHAYPPFLREAAQKIEGKFYTEENLYLGIVYLKTNPKEFAAAYFDLNRSKLAGRL